MIIAFQKLANWLRRRVLYYIVTFDSSRVIETLFKSLMRRDSVTLSLDVVSRMTTGHTPRIINIICPNRSGRTNEVRPRIRSFCHISRATPPHNHDRDGQEEEEEGGGSRSNQGDEICIARPARPVRRCIHLVQQKTTTEQIAICGFCRLRSRSSRSTRSHNEDSIIIRH